MTTPSVSVVIPTLNRAGLLRDALASALCQTCAPLEILVVDDGSTDETQAVVSAMGKEVRYFFSSSRGPAAARNVGIENARGDLIAFLDADDEWVPQALEWRVARLLDADAPPARVVLGLTQRVILSSSNLLEGVGAPWAANLFGSALCRREVFTLVGLLDETLQYGEDVDWFLRVREKNIAFAFLDRVTLRYRIHSESLMRDTNRAKRYMLRVIQKSLARRTDSRTGKVSNLAEMPDLQELLKMMRGPQA